MTRQEAIQRERDYEAQKATAREENWKAIQKIQDDLLRQELNAAFPEKPVCNIGRRNG